MILSLPIYKQLDNTCGLSTFLMLINPENHAKIMNVLDDLYDKLSFMAPETNSGKFFVSEFNWSIVIVYLLLKSLGKNVLSSIISSDWGELFDNYRIYTKHVLQDENDEEIMVMPPSVRNLYMSFFNKNKVNPYILKRFLHFMRTGIEIKILFSLFGGEFLPQQAQDGTGALFFTKEEIGKNAWKKKLDILQVHLTNKNGSKVPRVALNLEDHWVAVISIKEDVIFFNDPLTEEVSKIRVNEDFYESYRFYLFNLDLTKCVLLNDSIMKFLENEIQKESNLLHDFTTKLIKGLEFTGEADVEFQPEREIFSGILDEAREEAKEKPVQENIQEIDLDVGGLKEIEATPPISIPSTIEQEFKENAKPGKISDIESFTRNILENFDFQKRIALEKIQKSKPPLSEKKTEASEGSEKSQGEREYKEREFYKPEKKAEIKKEDKKEEIVQDIQDFTKNLIKQFETQKERLLKKNNE